MNKNALFLVFIIFIGLLAPFSVAAEQYIPAFELSAGEERYLNGIRDTPVSLATTSELISFVNAQGERSGLLQPLIDLMENQWGLTVETVNPGWDEAFKKLDSGEVDLLGLAILNENRRSVYNSTEALYNSNMDIYTRSEITIESIVELKGRSVGVLSNSVLPEMLEVYITPEGSVKYYKTVEELISAVERGEVFCAASSLAIQSELSMHSDVSYEISVESVITPQCIYANSERVAPLIDLINRYLASPGGASMLVEIDSNFRSCTLEKYREFYKDDIAYIKENYDTLPIFDSGMLYPLSYVENGQYSGLQNEINGIAYELTGVPVEILDYSNLAGGGDTIGALKRGEILAVAGIHRINEYSRDGQLEYSLPLMTDTLGFYVRQNNTLSSLSEMRIGSLDFGGSYMNFGIISGIEPEIYASRSVLIEDLRGNKLDAVFIGEMMTDYYYTVLNDYTLRRFDTLTVPASVHLLYNSESKSFNRIMNTAVELQAVLNPTLRQIWSNNSQNGKFEFMWLRNQMNSFQTKTIIASVFLIIALIILLLFVVYQLRRFSNFDKQISRMLSVQGNADMLWGNLKNGKLISKGGYPISKKLGLSQELTNNLMNVSSLKDDMKNIDDQGLEYHVRDIEMKPEDSDTTYFFRRFTHRIGESAFMVYLMDFTAEKYHERELNKLANTDHLTKLPNRRAMDELLAKKPGGLSANSGRVFMFMLDIDNFKQVNDVYGHDVGDKVLAVVARIIENAFSKGNVARWGGEEFLGIAELESMEKAVKLAEKILYEFESVEITVGSKEPLHCTVSCGVIELVEGESYLDAVTRADKAMYQAKFDGKNCVRFVGRDLDSSVGVPDKKSGENEVFDVSVTYNRTMSRLVHAFFHSRSIDAVIMELLKITTDYNGLDRAFLLEKTEDDTFKRTYVYDPLGLESTKFNKVITTGELMRIGHANPHTPRFVSDARIEITEEERNLRAKGLISFAELPIVDNGRLIGFVGFDNCRETREWTKDERRVLIDLSMILNEFIIRKNLEMKLTRSNAAMLTILDSVDDIVYAVELGTKKLLFANKKIHEYNGPINYQGKTCWEIFRPDLGGPCDFCMHDSLVDKNGRHENDSVRHEIYNSLAERWYDITDTLMDWDDGKKAVVMVCRDITDVKTKDLSMENMLVDLQSEKEKQKLLLESLQSQEVKTMLALEAANSFSWEYIPNLDKVTMNKTAEPLLGYPISDSGKIITLSEYFSRMALDYASETEKKLVDYVNGVTDFYKAEYPLVMANGEIKWYLDRGKYSDSKREVICGVCTDITDSKLYEQRLSERAYVDSLTGMLNKQYLSDGLIKPASDSFENFGGILLDIKSFKNFNEAFGYNRGDRIIESISSRLKELFTGKIILRISGNRFLAVFENTSTEALEDYAQKVLSEFERAVLTDGQIVSIKFRMGIAISPNDDLKGLLKNAEIALYSAKESLTEDYCVLNDKIRHAFKKKANMEFELTKAIERQEFVMYYQPEVLTATSRVAGAEALIRWRHPELGIVQPFDFIPLAEETGQIILIGEFVIDESAKQLGQWLDDGFDMFLSLNLSTKQFLSPQLSSNIQTALKKYKIPRDRLVVEITESIMISDFDHVRRVLEELDSLGVGIALDDFGMGYSSMNYLGKIPLDYLKIDKSIIDNATTVSKDRAILESIVTMSHKLGFKVTAEGVETAEQLKMLKGLDCDIIQGFYFSDPLSVEDFEKYHKKVNLTE